MDYSRPVNGAYVSLALALLLAVLFATLLRSWGQSIALPLIGAGFLLSIAPIGPEELPQPEIILITVLVPLVFGEALGSSYLDLRKVARPVLILAIGLVIVTTVSVGFVGAWVAALPLAVAMALGAILAPTDAVSVSAVARRASLPRRLVSVLEGESLVNDGTGLTALRVAIVAAVAGSVTVGEVALDFTLAVVSGVAVGLVSGYAMSWILRHSQDLVASNSVVIVAPFIIYVATERLDGSGILAIVVAALFVAHQQHSDPGAAGRIQSTLVWKHITFILQALAFFLIGFELPDVVRRLKPDEINTVIILVVATVITLIVARSLFVFAMVFATRVSGGEAAKSSTFGRESAILAWAGARGPISGLAAFSLPIAATVADSFPYRDIVLATSFIVIVITLILAETLAPVARLLKIPKDDDAHVIARVDGALARAALARLDAAVEELAAQGDPLSPQAVESLRQTLNRRLEKAASVQGEQVEVATEDQTLKLLMVASSMVHAEQEELIRMRDEDGLPDSIARPVLRDLDAREQALSRKIL